MVDKQEIKHHRQEEYCTARPAYRQGRRLTAVKAYTVNNESQHLFIYGVPSINLRREIRQECLKYGDLHKINVAPNVMTEVFTECFHAHFKRIQSARIAKRLLDTKSFFGSSLHVCYAPEQETVQETKEKLLQRKKDVLRRLPNLNLAK